MPLVYTHLEPNQIRVLNLLPGEAGDPIRCKLEVVSLDTADLSFEALSYVWGDPSDTTPINVDGDEVQVTVSLEGALRRLRGKTDFRVLWADAICIDQASAEEKKVQVPMMGKIYSKARKVLVWLGEPSICMDEAFAFCSEFPNPNEVVVPSRASAARSLILKRLAISTGFHELFSHHYWSRIWTFQEYELARKEPVLFCGAWGELSAMDLYRADEEKDKIWPPASDLVRVLVSDPDQGSMEEIDYARVAGVKAANRERGLQHWHTSVDQLRVQHDISERGWSQTGGHESSLQKLITRTSVRRCHDPRDRIYGVYGMIDMVAEESKTCGGPCAGRNWEGDRNPLPAVDYSRPHEEVFWDATVHLIRRCSSALDMLADHHSFLASRLDEGAREQARCPSWVIDFTRPCLAATPFYDPDHFPAFTKPHPEFFTLPRPQSDIAGGSSGDTSRESRLSVSHDGRVLHLEGWLLCSSFTTVTLLESSHVLLAIQLKKLLAAPPFLQDDQDEQQRLSETHQYRRRLATALQALIPTHPSESGETQSPDTPEGAADDHRDRAQELDDELSKFLYEVQASMVVNHWAELTSNGSGQVQALLQRLVGKRLIMTSGCGGRRIGITVPSAEDERDIVVVCRSLECLVVLRPVPSTGRYRMVGFAYVDGVMDNEHYDNEAAARVKSGGISNFDVE